MRRWTIAGAAAAGIAPLLLLACSDPPAIKSGENGTFANDCCGTIRLADGKMVLNDQQTVRYTVSKDADGPYVLPATFVGVVRYQGFDVDGTRSTLKLRLDRLPRPTTILLYEGSEPYVFKRQEPAG